MISFEAALQKAKEMKPMIDNCTEYENGFVFGCRDDDNYIGGYGHTPCVILKQNGKAVPMSAFIASGTGKEIRSFDL